jgi:hypothetical protein
MKTSIKYYLLAAQFALPTACAAQGPAYEKDIAIIVDVTDKMASFPTADEIMPKLGLNENPYQGIRITATTICDRDITEIKVLTLPAESKWTGNRTLRKEKIRRFSAELNKCLAAIRYGGKRAYTIAYRTIARQANRLAASTAATRWLLVYSDLNENDGNLNFYDPGTLSRLQKEPQGIATQLDADAPLKSLKGLQVWLVYDPVTFSKNNDYMAVARFYERLFAGRGAVTRISTKFQQL